MSQQVKVGLDLGTHSLKWAALDAQRRVKALWAGELLPDRETQHDQPHPRWLAARVGELLDECRQAVQPVWSDQVNVSVQGEGVVCGYLDLPEGTVDLERAVPAAVQQSVPFSVEDIELQWCEVPSLQTSDAGRGVFYGAYLRTKASQLRRLLESCGLEVKHLELGALALAREFRTNRTGPADSFCALVHSGFSHTQVLITRQGHPYYLRDFEIAGKQFTYSFQIGYQTNWARAVQYKLDYRVSTKDFQIEPFLLDWTDEIRRSLEHFSKRFAGARVSKVYLSGGTSHWQGLDRRLEEALGISVELDNWSNLAAPVGASPEDARLHKVSLGLALA